MRRPNAWFVGAACAWLAALMLASADVRTQDTAAAQPILKPGEVEALLAPIAPYPDSLLSQVLMASTNSLEIVYAARWLQTNPKVKGEAVIKPIESQPCDASEKLLLAFAQVLEPMNDRLDWTQKLGDAFLGQQNEVFAAVQRLRGKAPQAGSLNSGDQQKVIVEPVIAREQEGQTIVRIEHADPPGDLRQHVPDGAMDDVVCGKLCGGFGAVAWPIRYRDTGVMSFIVNHHGQVYEQDLGPDSAAKAAAMKSFDPGPGWRKVSP